MYTISAILLYSLVSAKRLNSYEDLINIMYRNIKYIVPKTIIDYEYYS